jgi:hypothetical protein
MQRALIQYRNPKNYDLVYEALVKAGREDLIGFDKKCLIKPRRFGANSGKKVESARNTSNTKNSSTEKKGKKKTIRNVHKKK